MTAHANDRILARVLMRYAQAALVYARLGRGHLEAHNRAHEAVDALFAAAKAAPEPYCTELFRLKQRLSQALDASLGMHPSDQEMEAVELAIDGILERWK